MKKLLHVGLNAKGYPYNAMQRAFNEATIYKEIQLKDLHNLKDEVISFRPDIIFMQIQGAGWVDVDLAKWLKDNCKKLINWTGDVRHPIPSWYKEVSLYCLTLFSNNTDVKELRENGYNVDFLQIGYDDEIFTPVGTKIEKHDIVFLGNNYNDNFPLGKERKEMVYFLKEKFEKRFGVYGFGWGDIADGECNNSLHTEASIYRGAKIAINYSHFNYDRYFSDRLLRLMGCGVFCLSHNYEGIRKDFNENELPTFTSLNELEEKIIYYLNNKEEREEIAMKGRRKVCVNFTYKSMINNLLELCDK